MSSRREPASVVKMPMRREVPDFVWVECEAARGVGGHGQRRDQGNGSEDSVGRDGDMAELEEEGVQNFLEKQKPTHGAVERCVGEPVLRRWELSAAL